MESLCLFSFGLRSRIKNISKIKQSNLFEHFLRTLKFCAISHGSFPCCSLTWLPISDRLCSSTRLCRCRLEMKVTGSKRPPQQASEMPVRIPLPFKDQRSAIKLREQLSDLSRNCKYRSTVCLYKPLDQR